MWGRARASAVPIHGSPTYNGLIGGSTATPKSKWDDTPPPITEADFPAGATKVRPQKKPNGEHPPSVVIPPIPDGESAFSLTERDLPQPVRLCDPWASEGVCIVAGRPKLGKTTLMRQLLAAAAVAGQYLDSVFPAAVKCAFLSLEEGELLCRSKFKKTTFSELALASIQLHFEWPRGAAGVDLLDRYLTKNPEIRIVCIDSLTKFRTVPDPRTPSFMADYEAVNLLHEMSKRHPGVCIFVVHHTRKAKSDDPIDDISGTYGLTAAADSFVVLRHHADGAVLHVAGRLWDREENQYTLARAPGHQWQMIGVHLDMTDEQREALEHVKQMGTVGITGKELGTKLNITQQSAYGRLDLLMEKGFVTKKFGRCYAK